MLLECRGRGTRLSYMVLGLSSAFKTRVYISRLSRKAGWRKERKRERILEGRNKRGKEDIQVN